MKKNIYIIWTIIFAIIIMSYLYFNKNINNVLEEYSSIESLKWQKILIEKYDNIEKVIPLIKTFVLELNPEVENEKNDFKKQILITETIHDFVLKQNRLNWTWSNVATQNPILAIQRLLDKNTWVCDTYWLINMYSQIAFGYKSRNLTLVREYWSIIWEPIWNRASHVITEVYSERYKKWYISDANFSLYYTYNEIPLSVEEIFNILKDNENNFTNWIIKPNFPFWEYYNSKWAIEYLWLYETIFLHYYTEYWYTLQYLWLYNKIDKKYFRN